MVFSCTHRKPIEVKKHRTDISFINNRDIHFDILNVACDSCFPIHDIGYRVRVKLSADEDSLIRTINLNSGKYHPTLLFGLVQRLFRLNLLIGSKDNNKTDYFRIM